MSLLPRKRAEGETGGIVGLQREMNGLFDRFFGGGEFPAFFGRSGFAPAVDVVETKDRVMVKAELPGVTPADLDISITGDVLTIRGEKRSEREEKDRNVHLVERSFGSFSRSVALPATADTNQVSAEYKDGILTVSLAKREDARNRTVQVEVK